MKNVLIICGSFPPQSIVGGLRPAMFAKYLPEYGWNPWVLTRDFTPEDPRYDENMPVELPEKIQDQIIRVKYSLNDEKNYLQSRNVFHIVRDFFYPEYSSPPGVYFTVKAEAEKLLISQRFDLILSTVPDLWQLTLGTYLSKKYKIPIIADFRDIIEQEDGFERPIREKIQAYRFLLRRWLNTRKVLGIITVSQYHRDLLEKKTRRNTCLIYNGYDRNMFRNSMFEVDFDGPFRIVYIGRILNLWYQNPELLFNSIDQLIDEKQIGMDDIAIEFYGTDREKLDGLIENLKYRDFIKFYNRISYCDVPKQLHQAQILLLLTNNGRKGILTTKFFEYAGVGKPILCIPGDQGELDQLIKDYKIGYSVDSLANLKTLIMGWVSSYKSGRSPIMNGQNVDFFSRQNQTKQLADFLNQMVM